MSYPDGLIHSKTNIANAEAWMLTSKIIIHEIVSNGSKKAFGDIIPVFLATTIVIPVSRKGTVKSTYACLSELILMEVTTISARELSNSATKPFHVPFCARDKEKHQRNKVKVTRSPHLVSLRGRRQKISTPAKVDRCLVLLICSPRYSPLSFFLPFFYFRSDEG